MTKRSVVQNVHVYLVGSDYYVPTVAMQARGTWVEVLPVSKIKATDLNGLATAIQNAKDRSGHDAQGRSAWDSENGRVWSAASRMWCLYWYDDGTLTIMPQSRIPTETDPETGEVIDGGWADDTQKACHLPANTPVSSIVSLLTP